MCACTADSDAEISDTSMTAKKRRKHTHTDNKESVPLHTSQDHASNSKTLSEIHVSAFAQKAQGKKLTDSNLNLGTIKAVHHSKVSDNSTLE